MPHLSQTTRAATLLLTTLAATITTANDWPQWRGPNRDAVWNETGLLKVFPPEGLKTLWRAPCGNGWASPVILDGRVYLLDARLESPKAEERIQCFDEATGQPLWTHTDVVAYPDWAFDPTQMMGPYATPIVEAGRLYSRGATGNLICLDTKDGSPIWSKDLVKEYESELFSGNAPCPLIEGNLLILMIGGKPDHCVVAFDKHTGQQVWAALTDTWAYSSPIVITAAGVRQLIVWRQHAISSLDPATGKLHWELEMITTGDGTVPTPVFRSSSETTTPPNPTDSANTTTPPNPKPTGPPSLLLISGLMLKLDDQKPAAEILWPSRRTQTARMLSNTSMPVIAGDCVFSARYSNGLVCLDANTGEELWASDQVTDTGGGTSIHITPNGDSMLLYTNKGELIRARLTRQGYEELTRTKLIEPTFPFGGRNVTWSVPAYANGAVFVRNHKELLCAALKDDG